MKIDAIENILNDMLQSLYEFKSGDVVYYQRQVNRIINHVKNQDKSNKALLIDRKTQDYHNA